MVVSKKTIITEITLEKKTNLESVLGRMGSVVVAYSGGIDSTFLSAIASSVLGNKALAVTANSPSLSPTELTEAITVAREIGLNHRIIHTKEVEGLEYRSNTPSRCFFCKDHLYAHLKRIATVEGYAFVVTGANKDDLEDFRPGLAAAKKHGVLSPLADVGLSKNEIRQISLEMKLSNWDKASQACLSSRIPYGTEVSVEALVQISKAEEFLRGLSIKQLRVRHHGPLARIEVTASDIAKIMSDHARASILKYFKSIGYTYVSIDLEGFRSGSLNEVLSGHDDNHESIS